MVYFSIFTLFFSEILISIAVDIFQLGPDLAVVLSETQSARLKLFEFCGGDGYILVFVKPFFEYLCFLESHHHRFAVEDYDDELTFGLLVEYERG